MTSAKIEMFLMERDRARARGDHGVDRSCTADLRRLGVPDEATLADPTGKSKATKRGPGRPRKPRCEHNRLYEHCADCNEELMVSAPYNSRLLIDEDD
jgi:hypothetical protein